MRIDNISTKPGDIGTVPTASYAIQTPNTTAVVWDGKLDLPSVAGASVLGNATFLAGEYGLRLTSASGGQTGNIMWNLTGSSAFDFTKDFRVSMEFYYEGVYGGLGAADGYFFNLGGTTTTVSSFAPADGGISMRLEPYRDGSGSYGYINSVETVKSIHLYPPYGLTMNQVFDNKWSNHKIEVRKSSLTNKRYSTLFIGGVPHLAMDISSWTPTGKVVTVGAWTGAAYCNQYVRNIVIEYI